MNEIQISTGDRNVFIVLAVYTVIVFVCAGVIYYYRGADRQLERELDRIEGLNHELASETRQLQAEIATHSVRIGNVASRVGNSKKRVQDVCVEIEQSAEDADRAIAIISQCEKIVEAIKTQR